MKKIVLIICFIIIIAIIIGGYKMVKTNDNELNNNNSYSNITEAENSNNIPNEDDTNITNSETDKLYLKVNGNTLTATLVNNSTTQELIKKLNLEDIKIDMEDYSNFEKVGELGFSLPRNDEQISTNYGDLILYQGNKFVIYYDKNNWNFTKIGKIDNISQSELKNILGTGDVQVVLSLNK